MATGTKEYYQILGVERDASADTIKKTYRKLALKYHPDRNPGDDEAEERFKEISEVYEVLSDPEKRQTYDRFGYEGVRGGFGQGGFRWEDFSHAGDFEDLFGDLFSSFFGGGGGRGGRAQARGRDLRVRLDLELDDVLYGKDREISLKRLEPCAICSGSGASEGSTPKTCHQCHGKGQVYRSQGFFHISTVCDVCQGQGRVIDNPCAQCRGDGREETKVRLKIHVPRGIQPGSQLRLGGEGEAGPQGTGRGDLYVVLNVAKHDFYERDGFDLHREYPISFVQAALGDQFEIETPWGKQKLKIPAGTQSGKKFRVADHGVPRADSEMAPRGDLYLYAKVAVPKKLDDKQKELLRQFAEASGDGLPHEDKGILGKVKDSIEDIMGHHG